MTARHIFTLLLIAILANTIFAGIILNPFTLFKSSTNPSELLKTDKPENSKPYPPPKDIKIEEGKDREKFNNTNLISVIPTIPRYHYIFHLMTAPKLNFKSFFKPIITYFRPKPLTSITVDNLSENTKDITITFDQSHSVSHPAETTVSSVESTDSYPGITSVSLEKIKSETHEFTVLPEEIEEVTSRITELMQPVIMDEETKPFLSATSDFEVSTSTEKLQVLPLDNVDDDFEETKKSSMTEETSILEGSTLGETMTTEESIEFPEINFRFDTDFSEKVKNSPFINQYQYKINNPDMSKSSPVADVKVYSAIYPNSILPKFKKIGDVKPFSFRVPIQILKLCKGC